MTLDRQRAVRVPKDTLLRELDGETVLLNLATGNYYSLDPVGTDLWKALTTSADIAAAIAALLEEYDVAEDELARDVETLLGDLEREGLVELTGP